MMAFSLYLKRVRNGHWNERKVFWLINFQTHNFDAEWALKNGYIDDHITYVIGTNSYEGNQYWAFNEHITAKNITSVFDITNGYEENKPTRKIFQRL